MCSTIALKRPGTTLPILQAAVIFDEGLVLCCLVSLQVAPAHSSSIIPVTMVTGSELSQTLMVQLPSQNESKKLRVGQLRETQHCSYCVECFYTNILTYHTHPLNIHLHPHSPPPHMYSLTPTHLTHTHAHPHTYTYLVHTLTHTCTLSLSHTHPHPLSYLPSLAHPLPPSHILTPSHPHPLTHTHTHTHTPYTHPRTQAVPAQSLPRSTRSGTTISGGCVTLVCPSHQS